MISLATSKVASPALMHAYPWMYPSALVLCMFWACAGKCWSALLYIGVTACWRRCQLGGHMEVLAAGASRLWATLGPNLGTFVL